MLLEGYLQPFQMHRPEGSPSWGISLFAISQITAWKQFRNKGSEVVSMFPCLESTVASILTPWIAKFRGVDTCHWKVFLSLSETLKHTVFWPTLLNFANAFRLRIICPWMFPWTRHESHRYVNNVLPLGNNILHKVIHYLFRRKVENVTERGEGGSLVVTLILSSVARSGLRRSHHT